MSNALLAGGATVGGYVTLAVAFYVALCFGLAVPVHPYYDYTGWSNANFRSPPGPARC
jgi:hypothetical protein